MATQAVACSGNVLGSARKNERDSGMYVPATPQSDASSPAHTPCSQASPKPSQSREITKPLFQDHVPPHSTQDTPSPSSRSLSIFHSPLPSVSTTKISTKPTITAPAPAPPTTTTATATPSLPTTTTTTTTTNPTTVTTAPTATTSMVKPTTEASTVDSSRTKPTPPQVTATRQLSDIGIQQQAKSKATSLVQTQTSATKALTCHSSTSVATDGLQKTSTKGRALHYKRQQDAVIQATSMQMASSAATTAATTAAAMSVKQTKKDCMQSPSAESRKRRAAANHNERKRMQNINAGFEQLRRLVPSCGGERLSKALVLQHACAYIGMCQQQMAAQHHHIQQLEAQLMVAHSDIAAPRVVTDPIHGHHQGPYSVPHHAAHPPPTKRIAEAPRVLEVETKPPPPPPPASTDTPATPQKQIVAVREEDFTSSVLLTSPHGHMGTPRALSQLMTLSPLFDKDGPGAIYLASPRGGIVSPRFTPHHLGVSPRYVNMSPLMTMRPQTSGDAHDPLASPSNKTDKATCRASLVF
eukprot:m.352214 g.352214  ORF g.352214 m.352214 type:complete len:526 (+) comp16466_c0_seq1:290-1867(+)